MEAEAMSAVDEYVATTRSALTPLGDPSNAAGMYAYMKGVAPFLGVKTPERRTALKAAWAELPLLDEPGLVAVCIAMWAINEREYQYAACDLIDRHKRRLTASFVIDPVESLIVSKSWWDTVDSLGNAAVSPITAREPGLVDQMWQWLDSGNIWLIRAAIQHQRGRASQTDFGLLYEMCDRFATEREFFIAKAIGWALRDCTRWDRDGVQAFVDSHPGLSAVARREALKGLDRSARPSVARERS
jgi:3-methyladenine DNA glycosylase AlkD